MDSELVVCAQNGDQAAFGRLAIAIGPRLHAVAYRILREVVLAEDATQQAPLDVWRDLPGLRDPARFDAWSYRVLVRVCYAHARSGRRRLPEISLDSIGERPGSDDIATILDRDQLERGFARLPVEQRAVVVLHHYAGLPIKEVAESVGAPVETVRARLRRAMAAMRAAIEADSRMPYVSTAATQEVAR